MLNYRDLRMAIAIVLAIACFSCFAEKPNLQDGGIQINKFVPCKYEHLEGGCAIVLKDDHLYMVMHDAEGQLAIYDVLDQERLMKMMMQERKAELSIEHVKLLWERGGKSV